MRGTDNETCREGAWPSRLSDVFKRDPFFAEAEKWADFDRSLRGRSPTPVKPRISQPRDCEVAFDADGKGNRHPLFVNPFFATLMLEQLQYLLTYLNPNFRLPSSLQHFVIYVVVRDINNLMKKPSLK